MAARECVIEPVDHELIKATVTYGQKVSQHRLSIDGQTLAAILRLQRDCPRYETTRVALTDSCYLAGLFKPTNATKRKRDDAFCIGEIRHSYVSWATNGGRLVNVESTGLNLAEIARALNHHSTSTTSRFYDVCKVPPMVVVPIKLQHPSDAEH
jgi:integrase